VFLVWSIINSSALSGLLNGSETLSVSGTNGSSSSPAGQNRDLKLVTLLGFDAIRSIENPAFLERTGADELYNPDELVLAIDIEGDTRAYSVPLPSRHEVVNDVVAGKPVAITW
jgi:hypothetical protein